MTQTIDQTIGAIIRKRRQHLGFSQDALAKLIGITFQQIQKYEKGSNALNSTRLVQVAAALNVPVAFFFESIPANPTPLHSSDRENLEMMKAFGRIECVTVRKRISDLARAMCCEAV